MWGLVFLCCAFIFTSGFLLDQEPHQGQGQTDIAILEQKYLGLEEKNVLLVDNLKRLQIQYASLTSALLNKTSELKNIQEKSIQQLKAVDSLQLKLQTMETLVNSLHSHEQARNQDVLVLQTQMQETKTKLSNSFDNLTTQMQTTNSNLDKRSMYQFRALEGRLYNVEKRQNDSLASVKQPVGLSACVLSLSSLRQRTTIKYQKIKTSEGITHQHLNSFKSSGEFVCEIPGLYHISVVTLSTTHRASVVIYQNNEELMRGHINDYYDGNGVKYDIGTGIAVTKLKKDETISIKTGHLDMEIAADDSCLTIVKVG
ncbi:unnamed protein product [Mytilus coruscus]|uniref:C1q domain-containing protein n=1 Tax=Mytilus coruscus TaxID=42192 RepID=A0A6J8D125_MYTCO|nr:unnamed protein product [Mytilus coruscus]